MDARFLRYYNRELQHLRDVGGEFAKEFPKIAGRLGLDAFECADPYVERLLEGFAFMAARVQLKIDAEFPRFTQHLFETIFPHYLCPTPSMVIVEVEPDLSEGALAEGYALPRDTILRSQIGKGMQTPCEYRTAHEVTMWPIKIVEAQYYSRDVATLDVPVSPKVKAAIRLRLRVSAGLTFDKLPLDTLTLHLRSHDATAMDIFEQLLGNTMQVVARPIRQPAPWHQFLGDDCITWRGSDDRDALMPVSPRSFQGYRLLHEYFVFPERFLFLDVNKLQPALERCAESEIDLIFLFDRVNLDLEGVVNGSHFSLNCTPAINLFPKRADRIHLTDKLPEYHVVADRTRPLDYEIYQVLSATGHGTSNDVEQEFQPFYASNDFSSTNEGGAYYAVRREQRLPSDRQRKTGPRSSYRGTEVFISLVDAQSAPFDTDLRQLSLSTKCTNRDLPLHMPVGTGRTDFALESGAPVERIRCIAGPTRPRISHAEGNVAWRILSHLSLNYLSIIDNDASQGASSLRDLLMLYGDISEAHIRKQIDGVASVRSRPIVRRIPTDGPIAFGRGLEITVTFDETMFEGSGIFLLGAVLEQFFARYVSINAFTETVVKSTERDEVMRWTARVGRRPII